MAAALVAEGHGRVLTAKADVAENVEKTIAPGEDATEAVAPTAPAVVENGANVWPDENAEAAFIADARQRGEPVKAAVATVQAAEEKEDLRRSTPPLAELVDRLSPAVREVLDDLFRVKFTTVRRVPKSVLKG
ncbi:MAG: hypothetical protein CK548_02165 [Opitutia bacterium]|nr:MAG: hypothetical protein CK548_02165 [Opitutae bacterium]